MASTDDLVIRLRLEMQQYVAEMAKMPGVSDAALKKFSRQHDKVLRKIERDSAKAAKVSRKEWDRNLDKMGGAAERTASLMGGVFGDVADSVIDLGGRVSEISGSLGGVTGAAIGFVGGVGAISAAVVFAGRAMDEWLQTNVQLRESLETIQGIEPISPSVIAALDEYNAAVQASDAVTAALALTVQGQLAPAFTDARHAMIGTTAAATEVVSWLDEVDAGTALWNGTINATRHSLPLLSNSLLVMGTAMGFAAQEGKKLDEQIKEWEDFGPSMELAGGATERAADSTRRLADEAKEARAEQLRHVQTVRLLADEFDRLYAVEQAGVAAAAAEKAAAAQMEAMYMASLEEAAEAAREKERAWLAEWADLKIAGRDLALGLTQDIGDNVISVLEAEAAKRDEILEQGRRQRQADRDKLDEQLEQGKITAAQHKERTDAIAKEGYLARREHRQTEREKEKAAKVAFRAIQGARVAEAAMQMPVNAAALMPWYSYAGPAAPGLAWGTAAAAFGAQAAAIRAQKPPEFPTGGVIGARSPGMTPDHQLVGAQTGEAVISRQGVAALGGAEGVAALNRGGGQQQPVVVMLDGETIGRAVSKAAKRGGLGREIDRRVGSMPGVRGSR